MVRKWYFIWAAAFFLVVFSCKELGNEKKKSEKSFGRTAVDYVIEEDTVKISDSVLLRYSSKMVWFPDLKDRQLQKEIYPEKRSADFSKDGLQNDLRQEKDKISSRLRSAAALADPGQQQQWSFISLMNVRMNRNNYVSVQYYTSEAAGENKVRYSYQEKVFDFKNLKVLQLADMITLSEETVKRTLKANLEKTTLMQQIKTYDPETYSAISAAAFPVSRNFYFDDYNLYFHYNANEIIRNEDIGDLIIAVSWSDLSGYIKPEFARRMKIN